MYVLCLVDGMIMRLFPELALYIYTCVQLVSIFPAICYVVQFVAKQTTLSCNTAAAFQLCISVAIALYVHVVCNHRMLMEGLL